MAVPSPPVDALPRRADVRRRFRGIENASSLESIPPNRIGQFMPSLSAQHALKSMYASLDAENWECIHAAVKAFIDARLLWKYKLAFSCCSKWSPFLQQMLPNLLTEFATRGDVSDKAWIHCAMLTLGRPCIRPTLSRSRSLATSQDPEDTFALEEQTDILLCNELEMSVARRSLRFVNIRRLPTRSAQMQPSVAQRPLRLVRIRRPPRAIL